MPCFNLSETHFSPSWLQLFPKKSDFGQQPILLYFGTKKNFFEYVSKPCFLWAIAHLTWISKRKKRRKKRSASLVKNKTLLRFGRKCFSKIFTQSVPICRKIIGTVSKKKLCKSSLKWCHCLGHYPKREPSIVIPTYFFFANVL